MERSDAVAALAEVFRTYGFEGASLSVITRKTGLGKGSLYHFFPGGKEEMAEAVLAEIRRWFEEEIFRPLREAPDAQAALAQMFAASNRYFRSGRRVCLVGAFALGQERERFGQEIQGYFATWIADLANCLQRAGHTRPAAEALAEDTVSGIQGALVLSRSLDEPALFLRALDRIQNRLQ